ncbi:hypothetical protein J5N97_025999 [Dioscorea zingiberensis]|uniref:Uncharacterized protein n=1 Tax=Dioscorea zingiberensis TaxID=325984 RepID=A0A9D5H6C2_9LILI|nr:hypothetical protein J5N97_025999 [Dioscorea zingiberensis]
MKHKAIKSESSSFYHSKEPTWSLHPKQRKEHSSIHVKCASTVDDLASFYFNNITVREIPPAPTALNLARHIAECPTLFPKILKTLFEMVLFEDCGNQWSLIRPILSLIVISEQMFNDLKAQILSSQPVDQHQRLSQCFDVLMADVARGFNNVISRLDRELATIFC